VAMTVTIEESCCTSLWLPKMDLISLFFMDVYHVVVKSSNIGLQMNLCIS
jgi:hypothetical protein